MSAGINGFFGLVLLYATYNTPSAILVIRSPAGDVASIASSVTPSGTANTTAKFAIASTVF